MVLQKLDAGEGVIVHCAGGTGRTGTVLGAVLKRQGVPDADVLDFLKRVNQLRGKNWPEAEWQWQVVQRVGPRK
jgi:protein-tyrosine phosphatase